MIYAGIDIGKRAIHVAIATPSTPPKLWRVTEISTLSSSWQAELAELLPPSCVVAIESTGYHYSAPVFTCVQGVGCEALEVHNSASGSVRKAFVAKEKDDFADARALAYIAREHTEGRPIHGVHKRNERAIVLRMSVNERHALIRIKTRLVNRAEQLAYSISPAYAHNKAALMHCLRAGLILPQDVRAADWSHLKTSSMKSVNKLIADLPDYVDAPYTLGALMRASEMLNVLEMQLEGVEESIRDAIESNPNAAEIVRLWMTIPAMSYWAAAACLAPCSLDPLSVSVDGFKKLLGVAPDSAASGGRKNSKKTTGYTPAKSLLHLVAMAHLKDTGSPIVKYRERDNATFFSVKRKIVQAMYGIARTRTEWKGA